MKTKARTKIKANTKFLAKNVLNGSLTVTTWAFETLMGMGELTIDAFLRPSHYADLPSRRSFSAANKKISKRKISFKENTVKHSLWRLQKQGLVQKMNSKYILTRDGKDMADYIKSRKTAFDKKWDRKFRVVIFDIPEKDRYFRSWLRQELYVLRYEKLQQSVFIGKYPITKDLMREIKKKKMEKYVNYLLVDKVFKNF